MKTTELNPTVETVRSLKNQYRTDYLGFSAKQDATLAAMSARMGVAWNSSEDITEHVTAADFVSGGFNQSEAAVMVFVLTQDCMGESVNSMELIQRWFSYCA